MTKFSCVIHIEVREPNMIFKFALMNQKLIREQVTSENLAQVTSKLSITTILS